MTDNNETKFRITTADKDRLTAIALRSAAMAGEDATALAWASKAESFFDEAIRAYQAGEIEQGDKNWRMGGEAIEKASKSLGR